jgi:hypothetical protein
MIKGVYADLSRAKVEFLVLASIVGLGRVKAGSNITLGK